MRKAWNCNRNLILKNQILLITKYINFLKTSFKVIVNKFNNQQGGANNKKNSWPGFVVHKIFFSETKKMFS